jgi:hypothetical protein
MPNMPFGDIERAENIKDRMGEVAGMEAPGHLEQLLKSPRGIVALLGTLGVGLSGGGLEGAAAFGLGAAAPVMQAKAEAEQAKADKLSDLGSKLDDQEAKIMKRQQMIQTAIQNAPDQFVDPETGELALPPEMMGYLAYGMPIAVDPSSKRTQDRRDEAWSAQLKSLSEGLKNVESVEDATIILTGIDKLLDNPNPDVEQNRALARAFGTPEWNNQLAGYYMSNGGESARTAMLYAAENDLPLEHEDVIRLLDFKQGADNLPPSQRAKAEELAVIEEVAAWEANPANAPLIQQIDSDAETPEERNRLIYTSALKTASKIGLYEAYMGRQPSFVQQKYQRQYNASAQGWKLTDTVMEGQDLNRRRTLSPEQLSQERVDQVVTRLMQDEEATQTRERDKTMGWLAQQGGNVASRFGKSNAWGRAAADMAYAQAKAKLPDGTEEEIRAEAQILLDNGIEKYEASKK